LAGTRAIFRLFYSVEVFAMPKVSLQRIFQKTRFDLPDSHNLEIGKIVIRWAHYEHYVQNIIWAIVLNGDPKGAALGRIAVRETKPDEQLGLLEWVAEIRSIKLDRALLKSMKPRAKELSSKRNLVAHGLWTEVSNAEWLVQETRGAWEESKDGPRGSKKIQPEAVPMSARVLKKISTDLESLIADAKTLKGRIGEAPQ
jgi:hypothetical protein